MTSSDLRVKRREGDTGILDCRGTILKALGTI